MDLLTEMLTIRNDLLKKKGVQAADEYFNSMVTVLEALNVPVDMPVQCAEAA